MISGTRNSGWLTTSALLLFCLAFPIASSAATLYVDLNSTNPTPPFTNWLTAATNIQDAVDVATNGDTVLVTNGLYNTGGQKSISGGSTITNRIVITNSIIVQSVNGPTKTIIEGSQAAGTNAVRCAVLTVFTNALLSGFTLTNGSTLNSDYDGGGGGVVCVWPGVVISNCIISGNSGSFGGGAVGGTLVNCIITGNRTRTFGGGGGLYYCTARNCLVISNSAFGFGGGAYNCNMDNCTIVSNSSSSSGGGIYGRSDRGYKNCIIYYNTAPSGPNYDSIANLTNCCSTPVQLGIVTQEPTFVNLATGDFRLQSNSPCINAGNNSYTTNSTDLDGNPRIVGGTVDIGAYEFQSPSSVLSYAWAQQFGLSTDGSADFADTDADGMNNLQEWIAGTVPTNNLSLLKLLAPTNSASGITVTWQSVSNRTYFLQRASDVAAQPAFSNLKSNITGQPSVTTYTDTNAVNSDSFFYRVGIQ